MKETPVVSESESYELSAHHRQHECKINIIQLFISSAESVQSYEKNIYV